MEGEKKVLEMSAVDIQQEYYETIGDADWELYEKKDRKYLLQKVAVALCGPPSKEGNLKDDDWSKNKDELKLQGYETRDEETVMTVFNKILEQAKYSHNGANLVISILRVVCVIPSKNIPIYKKTPKDYWLNLHNKKGDSVHILVFHVFSIRKCISINPEVRGCKIFIDHDARVYETWMDYLSENKLPKCVMVVPENGEYRGMILKEDEMPAVKYTVLPSPELGPSAQVLKVTDNISTAANVGALVAVVGSLFAAPVVAPVMVSAAVGVGAASGVYSIGRSIAHLVDRAKHEQNIGLDNSEARSSWINILISTVGVSFATAGKLLTWAAASGRNVKILMSALQYLKYTNIATGFIGVGNSLGDMIYKFTKYGEKPSPTEVFQFTTSLLFLGIGIMSNQTAQEIVEDTQAKKINEIRDSLSSNNKRKIFDKVTAETRRVKGTIDGNSDVIRGLKTIKNKEDFFRKFKTINKSVNKNKVRVSLSPDGKVLVNNQHKVGISKLYRMGENGRSKLFAKYGPAKVTTKNAPTRIYPSYAVASSSNVPINDLAYTIRPEEILKITAFIINLTRAEQDFIVELLSHMSEKLHDGFLLLCTELITSLVPVEIEFLNSIYPDWKRGLVLFVFNYLKSKVTVDEDDSALMAVLKSYIRNGVIDEEMLLEIKSKLIDLFSNSNKNDIESRNKCWYDADAFMRKHTNKFSTLKVGQVLTIGPHTVLVKQVTVENIEMWLQNYSQEECDMFTDLCFEIISILTKQEVCLLNNINLDEDIIMRVSRFLLENFDTYIVKASTFDMAIMALSAKCDIMEWFYRQRMRSHYTCEKCLCITYSSKANK